MVSVATSTLEVVPTSGGVLAATLTHPPTAPAGAVAVFTGWECFRSGPNRLWARLAEELAAVGLVVLRADHPGVGESDPPRRGVDRADVAAELLEWFGARIDGAPLCIVGSCYGARVALRLSSRGVRAERFVLVNPDLRRYLSDRRIDRAVRLFLAAPVRTAIRAVGRPVPGPGPRARPWDRSMVAALVEAACSAPVHAVVGERDWAHSDIVDVQPEVAAAGGRLEIEIVEATALESYGTRRAQDEVLDRVRAAVVGDLPGS